MEFALFRSSLSSSACCRWCWGCWVFCREFCSKCCCWGGGVVESAELHRSAPVAARLRSSPPLRSLQLCQLSPVPNSSWNWSMIRQERSCTFRNAARTQNTYHGRMWAPVGAHSHKLWPEPRVASGRFSARTRRQSSPHVGHWIHLTSRGIVRWNIAQKAGFVSNKWLWQRYCLMR